MFHVNVKNRKYLKKMYALIVLLAIIVSSVAVVAEEIDAASFNFGIDTKAGNSTARLRGRVHGDRVHKLVAVQVLFCGVLSETVMYEEFDSLYRQAEQKLNQAQEGQDFKDIVFHYSQQITDSQGNFEFEFDMDGKQYGLYAARIYVETSPAIAVHKFTYYPAAKVDEVLTAINNADVDGISSIIKQSGHILNADSEAFVNSGAGQSNISRIIVQNRDSREAGKKSFTDVNDFLETFSTALIIHNINVATSGTEVKRIFETNEDIISYTSSPFYSDYLGLSVSGNQAVSDNQFMWNKLAVSATDLTFIQDVENVFSDTVFLTLVEKMYSWPLLEPLIRKNDRLELDLTKYTGSNVEKVGRALAGKPYDDIQAFSDAFDAELNGTTTGTNTGTTPGTGTNTGTSTGSGTAGGSKVSGASTVYSSAPSSDTTKSYTPIATPTPEIKSFFSDIDHLAWAKDSINDLAAIGIVNGRSDNIFDPGANVKREEFVKMAVLAFGLVREGARCSFDDVNRDDWFYTHVSSAVRAGIINGVSEESFGTGMDITRQDMAVIAQRLTKHLGIKLPLQAEVADFSDSDQIAEYAVDAVREMQLAGIINGIGDNTFNPEGVADRAQTAVIIDKLYKIANN